MPVGERISFAVKVLIAEFPCQSNTHIHRLTRKLRENREKQMRRKERCRWMENYEKIREEDKEDVYEKDL